MLSSIENHYERLVAARISELLAERGETFDAGYFDDLACVALNYLPPRYVRHSIDFASHQSDEERSRMAEEVADAVAFAFETTRRRRTPRTHEED
ncbi:competence protein ComFB [Marichromatium purpuratum 984]|uniref:Competence protein ComFB n=1 Tax=Marichromatium purpuratum 984 TaxID=765910 RepID=W0E3F1_MARPU|nr:late competence development ComFB family protein [Marichromatium purpuratum]AHF03626.1 competence protein ComFB [Marichromatium purpuratum 984]